MLEYQPQHRRKKTGSVRSGDRFPPKSSRNADKNLSSGLLQEFVFFFPNLFSSVPSPRVFANNMARSKDKKRESESGEGDGKKDEPKNDEPTLDYDELVKRVCAIANPLAGRKLTKRLYKTVKKGKRREVT